MELIKKLEQTKESTLVFFDLSNTDLNKTYEKGKWNVRQLLHHLADAETVLYDRVRRIISNPNQVIWNFDQNAWADKLAYEKFPLHLNKNIYKSVRESMIYLASEYYETLGTNQFVHSNTGLRTLKDEFDKVAFHNQHHLNQIIKALTIV